MLPGCKATTGQTLAESDRRGRDCASAPHLPSITSGTRTPFPGHKRFYLWRLPPTANLPGGAVGPGNPGVKPLGSPHPGPCRQIRTAGWGVSLAHGGGSRPQLPLPPLPRGGRARAWSWEAAARAVRGPAGPGAVVLQRRSSRRARCARPAAAAAQPKQSESPPPPAVSAGIQGAEGRGRPRRTRGTVRSPSAAQTRGRPGKRLRPRTQEEEPALAAAPDYIFCES
ncbi:uncharacterized protein LOC144581684 [Callithrix jacchus]